ncbi:MAG TPA: hypothetical protein VF518_06750, partial [Polyangia bacterium]
STNAIEAEVGYALFPRLRFVVNGFLGTIKHPIIYSYDPVSVLNMSLVPSLSRLRRPRSRQRLPQLAGPICGSRPWVQAAGGRQRERKACTTDGTLMSLLGLGTGWVSVPEL